MSTGTIVVFTYTGREALPVTESLVTIRPSDPSDTRVWNLRVDEMGRTPPLTVDAPPKELSLDENNQQQPYSLYDIFINAEQFASQAVRHVEVFAGEVSLQEIEMIPFVSGAYTAQPAFVSDIPQHSLFQPECVNCGAKERQAAPFVIQQVVVPAQIAVHLGAPDANAENLYVSFPDYIKNVCSSEIYPTWPESAILANIHAQVSFALNRIYTEWYPSRGYPFQITSTTQYDQKFIKNRNIFENISQLVDQVFNLYVSRIGSNAPLFTEYCDGKQSNCNGLKQWGTVTLANAGYTPIQILRNYYGNDIALEETDSVASIPASYPGTPLQLGSTGTAVRIIQTQLRRISNNYPLIPRPTPDGVFDSVTDEAVRVFQRQFSLEADGIVGKATWYRLSFIYVSVTNLAELGAENENLPTDAAVYPGRPLRRGDRGEAVSNMQYYLRLVSDFYENVASIEIDGVFGADTEQAVRSFQRSFGLTVDGVVGPDTWNLLYRTYLDLEVWLPGQNVNCPPYPGALLREGSRGANVTTVQNWLNRVAASDSAIPRIDADGIFGPRTRNAVAAFQRRYGLDDDGIVGPDTWPRLCEAAQSSPDAADAAPTERTAGAASASNAPDPRDLYPGTPLDFGHRGEDVAHLQHCLCALCDQSLPNTGIYDNATRWAVMDFQHKHHLPAHGRVDAPTWNALIDAYRHKA